MIHEFEAFRNGVVLYMSYEMKQKIVILDKTDKGYMKKIEFPENVSLIEPSNSCFNQDFLDVNVYSYVKPLKTFKIPFTTFKVQRQTN